MSETKPEIPPAMLGAAAAAVFNKNYCSEWAAGRLAEVALEAAGVAELEADSRRLRWLMECGAIDGFSGVVDDRYDFAAQVMSERDHDEPTPDDEFEGWRRLIDAAMIAPSGAGGK